jgi:hypothetical protein
MGARPRFLVSVAVVLVAVLVGTGVAASRPAAPVVVTGSVTVDGTVTDAPGWTVTHAFPGVYRVAGPASGVVLDVPIWAQPADVAIVPVGGGASDIRFVLDGRPVDTRFSFTARGR